MEPDRDDLSAVQAGLRAAKPGEAQLRDLHIREAWRRRSLATSWRTPDDWHSAAVDEILAACRNRAPAPGEAGLAAVGADDLTAACAGLGRARAQAGIGIAETIDDLAALFAVLGGGAGGAGTAGSAEEEPGFPGGDRNAGGAPGFPGGETGAGEGPGFPGGEGAARGKPGPAVLGRGRAPGGGPCLDPPLPLICAVAEGWAAESLDQFAQGGCEDPLSGLATLAYLRTRLAEVYREAEHGGTSPADTHRLLVVRLPRRPDPWRRMALAILVGHDLRAAFPGGDTLSMARPGPAIALVRAHGDLPLRYARLRRNIQATFGTQIRMTPLPGVLTDALRLVDELAR